MVLSGGTAMPKGFLEQFTTALKAQDFPVRLSEVWLSEDPLNSIRAWGVDGRALLTWY